MKWNFSSLALVVTVLVAGCNTFNVPFVNMAPDYSSVPVEDLREAAGIIEAAVQKGDRDISLPTIGAIKLDIPEIQQVIRARTARNELLNILLDSGHAYEGPSGLVYILRSSAYKKATTRNKRDRDALLVMGENNDRWALYEGLMKLNNFPPKSLSAIQAVFYEARIAGMGTGQKYKTASGEHVTK